MAKSQFTTGTLPKIDFDALFAMQKANLAVVHEAQTVLVEAGQAILRAQYDYVAGLVARANQSLAGKEPKKAETVIADVKAAAEQAVTVGKQNVELGFAAQRRVTDLVTQRAQANLDELKTLAA